MTRGYLGEHSLPTSDHADRPAPYSVEESSDLGADVQRLDPNAVEPEVELSLLIVATDLFSYQTGIQKQLQPWNDASIHRINNPTAKPRHLLPPRRQLEGMNMLHQNAFSKIQKHQAELHHVELGWVRRWFCPRIGGRD